MPIPTPFFGGPFIHSPTKPGVAKRLASNLETLAPEEVATAAQSLVALRHAPMKLMEATQKVAQLKLFLRKMFGIQNLWTPKFFDVFNLLKGIHKTRSHLFLFFLCSQVV